ncbi:cyclopropane fatty acyl phospholipid synthase [Psychrilyobacter atlanticus]|uniref:cyclopropane fatty acyl phospholipid synthase n=1 Tax=Psychrilyobacter atlanticus TaxID=271091 RepID=UPI000411B74F|nr:cyclopropane fatty acyl phospholipid synthase [Psychrilyobacter atlanticus]
MKSSKYKIFEKLLEIADIKLDGDRPWDIKIKDEETFDRVIAGGSLGFGEAYMDNLWECESIDEMINRVLRAQIDKKLSGKQKLQLGGQKLKQLINPQSILRVKKDVPFHYDLGNDIFESMLDKYMTYTCAYFKDTENLDEAQEKKLDLVCKKMGLKPGMRVLDIGCGWGSFMKYAAEHYGVICDGLTLSKEQKKLGEVKCKGLTVNFILQDYREFDPIGKYDRVVSIGMIEHVGPLNYKEFFECADNFLKNDGLFLLHTIGGIESHASNQGDPWIKKYIFPNGIIPSISQLGQAMEKKFNLEDLHNIGENYDKTLVEWNKNFEARWDNLKDKYGDKFYRMWRYYLLSCAGAFRSRDLNTWQLVLSKIGRETPEFSRVV